MHIDTIVIFILVVYGSIHMASLYSLSVPVSAKIISELTQADLYIHHEIEIVHSYLINQTDAEIVATRVAENIEANLEILEKIS